MSVVTRFAPSPTGYLHIGGARTALFNWLFARHHGGKFLLRIEDTDRARSTQSAIDAIHEGLRWLGLDWDEEAFYQFARAHRHAEVAHQLVAEGKAYYCYCSQEDLEAMREQAKAEGKPFRYDGRWRDRDDSEAPPGVKPVVRIKAPTEGEIVTHDVIVGEVRVECSQLDDMILLRSDGTPTYMLAVVVDDHDMGITHVIRGADHLSNTPRQMLIYRAMDWSLPQFAHIPLIHGADGAKLSKRHGALGAEYYRDQGFLPEAMRNYLLRLGWAHGDDETIRTEQAIAWFDLDGVGKSPARFDLKKLENLNGHYIREAHDDRLVSLIAPMLEDRVGKLSEAAISRLTQGMHGLKQRAVTLLELAANAAFYVALRPLAMKDKAKQILDKGGREILTKLLPVFEGHRDWEDAALQQVAKDYGEKHGVKLGDIAQPLRAALTGSNISPGVFEVMAVLGKEESLGRLRDIVKSTP